MWISDMQTPEGGWSYYADEQAGNFVDGFHTCLVIRNLAWAERLTGEQLVDPAVLQRGEQFIRMRLIDDRTGLVRRFCGKGEPTPFKWDLYDQAEWLAVLIERGAPPETAAFIELVGEMFVSNGQLHSRVDILGRRSGSAYPRWGILPWQLHCQRFETDAKRLQKDVI